MLNLLGHEVKRENLLSFAELIEGLKNHSSYPNTYQALNDLSEAWGEYYLHIRGLDAWYNGGFYVPVKEGIAYLPYDNCDRDEGYESLEVDAASLVDKETMRDVAIEFRRESRAFGQMLGAMAAYINEKGADDGITKD